EPSVVTLLSSGKSPHGFQTPQLYHLAVPSPNDPPPNQCPVPPLSKYSKGPQAMKVPSPPQMGISTPTPCGEPLQPPVCTGFQTTEPPGRVSGYHKALSSVKSKPSDSCRPDLWRSGYAICPLSFPR